MLTSVGSVHDGESFFSLNKIQLQMLNLCMLCLPCHQELGIYGL